MAEHPRRLLSGRARIYALYSVFGIGILAVALWRPIPISPTYHNFADRRVIFGIPDGLNVLSNVLFLLVGVIGVLFVLRARPDNTFRHRLERLPYLVFFAGTALTGLGSAYYHLAPGNQRLIWDLLPMTACYAALLSATIMERVSERVGLGLLGPLIAAGAACALYWRVGQLHGHGDYRLYLFAQFFSAVAIGAIVLLFPPTYSGGRYLALAFAFYIVAKLFETFDKRIYSDVRVASGHTLKHLAAGIACYFLLRMLAIRHSLVGENVQPGSAQCTIASENYPDSADSLDGGGYVAPGRRME